MADDAPPPRRKKPERLLRAPSKTPTPPSRSGSPGRLAKILQEMARQEALDEQRKRLEEHFIDEAILWLREKWGPERPCPYCGTKHWELGSPFELPTAAGGFLSPHFPVMCSNCGNTVFINAVRAGLFEDPDEAE